MEWFKTIGGTGSESIESISQNTDGTYTLAGYFSSTEIQIGNETLTNNGEKDGMIIKISESGEILWSESIGGTLEDSISYME